MVERKNTLGTYQKNGLASLYMRCHQHERITCEAYLQDGRLLLSSADEFIPYIIQEAARYFSNPISKNSVVPFNITNPRDIFVLNGNGFCCVGKCLANTSSTLGRATNESEVAQVFDDPFRMVECAIHDERRHEVALSIP